MKRVIGAHDWASPVNRALIRPLLGDSTGATGAAVDRPPADSLPAAR